MMIKIQHHLKVNTIKLCSRTERPTSFPGFAAIADDLIYWQEKFEQYHFVFVVARTENIT